MIIWLTCLENMIKFCISLLSFVAKEFLNEEKKVLIDGHHLLSDIISCLLTSIPAFEGVMNDIWSTVKEFDILDLSEHLGQEVYNGGRKSAQSIQHFGIVRAIFF